MSEHCRDCGAAIEQPHKRRQGRCQACFRRHCCTCDALMPPERVCRDCTDCRRKHDEARKQRPRRCYLCGCHLAPVRGDNLCSPCSTELKREERKLLAKRPKRPCPDCGQPVGEARTSLRCLDCERRYRAKLRARPGRLCPMCGRSIGKRRFCPGCKSLYDRWYHAYQNGDPGARALRPLRPYTRYKEANP